MIKRYTLAVILVISVLSIASVVVTLAYFDEATGNAKSSTCVGYSCTSSFSSITTTTTTTSAASDTTTVFITVPITRTITSTQTITTTQTVMATTNSCCNTSTHRLGFWIDERDMWSAVGLNWTSQQFITNYFLTAPYPSAMLFATSLRPTGPYSPGAIGEAQWLGQVANLSQSLGLNVKIMILFFVNLSGATINGVPDQTTLLTQYMAALGNHSNIVNTQYEIEYYGDTLAEITSFNNIMINAGYTPVFNAGDLNAGNFSSEKILDYSEYPYFNGTIPTSLSSGSRTIGIGYGETGAPYGATSNPAWTQASIQAIIDSSPANPYVMIYAGSGGTGQPAYQLWNWPTLQQWIWTDPNYQTNFILAP
jgi:hypothetical protein